MLLSSYETLVLLLSISIMLIGGKLFSELFIRLKLPPVIGQIIAGIIIGPTILGNIMPNFFSWLFPQSGNLYPIIFLGLIFIMLKLGIEVDLSAIAKQGRSIVIVSFFSIIVPLLFGFSISWYCPLLSGTHEKLFSTSLFFAIAVAITALPVIATILLDIKIFHTDLGMIILSSAMINDLVGWVLFSSLIKTIEVGSFSFQSIMFSFAMTLLITIIIITVFRNVINELFPFIQAKTQWPGGVITFALVLSMFLASLTEAIGIHAFFGSFLAGIVLGYSPHLKAHTKDILNQFIDNFFAPLFFVSIGLQINLFTQFSFLQSLLLIIVVFASNVAGCLIAGILTKTTIKDSLAIGIGLSTSGTMGIIIGLFALEYNLINQATYTSIVIMAIVTSLSTGPLLKIILKPKQHLSLIDMVNNNFIPNCNWNTLNESIHELSYHAYTRCGIDASLLAQKIIERENIMSTGIGDSIAIPHVRLHECKKPLVLCATNQSGVDFNAFDGQLAKIIFLIITPYEDYDLQIFILSEISKVFSTASIKEQVLRAKNNNELIAILKNRYHILSLEKIDGTA
ncbi:MAG: cation:proton antiporter domain-containing protein [Spirochaetota bacterium]